MMLHIALHFICPILIALVFYRSVWKKASSWMIATMLIDLDHLLASPIYDPNRCSINFHPLHQYEMITVYAVLFLASSFLLWKKTKENGIKKNSRYLQWISLGLLIHMALDASDCWF